VQATGIDVGKAQGGLEQRLQHGFALLSGGQRLGDVVLDFKAYLGVLAFRDVDGRGDDGRPAEVSGSMQADFDRKNAPAAVFGEDFESLWVAGQGGGDETIDSGRVGQPGLDEAGVVEPDQLFAGNPGKLHGNGVDVEKSAVFGLNEERFAGAVENAVESFQALAQFLRAALVGDEQGGELTGLGQKPEVIFLGAGRGTVIGREGAEQQAVAPDDGV
jgi:hypothetical protein